MEKDKVAEKNRDNYFPPQTPEEAELEMNEKELRNEDNRR